MITIDIIKDGLTDTWERSTSWNAIEDLRGLYVEKQIK